MAIPVVKFSEVQTVLDSAIAGWRQANGNAVPKLTQKHQDQNFGWSTKQQLLDATARGFRLVDPLKIGTSDRQGKNTNLVIALSDPNGVAGKGQMPDGGPYLNITPDIQKIIDWIDGGCND